MGFRSKLARSDHRLLVPTFELRGFKPEFGFNLIHMFLGILLRVVVELLPCSSKRVSKNFELFNNGDTIEVW